MSARAAHELDSEPALGGLYARALLGAVLPGGDALPDDRLARRDVPIDREHLASYDRVCGFPLGDALPPTYLHVVAFPLAMALMTRRSFPFSLLGMVHVANRIEQRRRIGADERVTICAWAERLRPHRQGRQFDVVAEAEIGGEAVWSERSTYLSRGKGSDESADGRREPDPPTEPVARLRVPGDIGRRYAAVSGDRNPIHLNAIASRLFGIRGPIAHGMWMKARCLAAFEGAHADACAAEVRFAAPLKLPAEVALASAPRRHDTVFALRAGDGDRVYLTGSIEPLP